MEAKGPAALSNSHPPTHVGAAGTQTRDPGPQGVACTSCPNSGSRRKLSIETSYNRGCPPKQNNPVLGQQPAARGRAPGELPDPARQLSCCERVQSPRAQQFQTGCPGRGSTKGDALAAPKQGAPAVALSKGGCPGSTKVGCPGCRTAKEGCSSHSRTEAGCPGHSTAKGGVP